MTESVSGRKTHVGPLLHCSAANGFNYSQEPVLSSHISVQVDYEAVSFRSLDESACVL